jgi:hypothetical protein
VQKPGGRKTQITVQGPGLNTLTKGTKSPIANKADLHEGGEHGDDGVQTDKNADSDEEEDSDSYEDDSNTISASNTQSMSVQNGNPVWDALVKKYSNMGKQVKDDSDSNDDSELTESNV